jgi:hypothetical protein
MSDIKIYNEVISLRISQRCSKAWHYLQSVNISPSKYLKEGGESLVIQKANDFYLKTEKKKDNLPDSIFAPYKSDVKNINGYI